MRILRTCLPLIFFVFLLMPGCQNQQTGEYVSLSEILFGASDAVKQFQESELHELLPADVKAIIAIVTIGLTALGNVVLALKNSNQKKIITELVVENPDLKTKSIVTDLKVRKIRKVVTP
ncbi:hypothetical protein ES703_95828 [subsurface metagenome]